MKCRSLLAGATLLATFAISSFGHAADAQRHQGRLPSGGTGAPGAETLDEGAQVGAPGNIVTATEGTALQAYDVDSNAKVSVSEASTNGELSKQFARLDANQDEMLDADEFKMFTPTKSAVSGTAPTTIQDAKESKAR